MKTKRNLIFGAFLFLLLGQFSAGFFYDGCLLHITSASFRRVRLSDIAGLLPPPTTSNLPNPQQWRTLKERYSVKKLMSGPFAFEREFEIADKRVKVQIPEVSIEIGDDIVNIIVNIIKREYADNKDYTLLINYLFAKDKGIPGGRIRLLVDDTGKMRYDEISDVSWSEVEGAVLYVHLSKQFYDAYKDNRDNLGIIAKAIVREYEKLLLPEYILSSEASPLEKRDALILLVEGYAATDNKQGLIGLLKDYDPTLDTSFTLKNIILKALYDIYEESPETIITRGEDLLLWYRVQREWIGENLSTRPEKEGFIFRLSEQMRQMEQNGAISAGLLPQASNTFNDYFFAIEIDGETIYLPNINISLKEHGFEKTGYIYNEDALRLIEDASRSKDIDTLLATVIGHKDAVPLLQIVARKIKAAREEIDDLNTQLANLSSGQKEEIEKIKDRLKAITTYAGENVTDMEGVRNLLVLAVYDQPMVDKLLEEIEYQGNGQDRPLIVTIPAAGGAGKSTLAEYLKIALENKELTAALKSTDDYLYPKQFRYAPRDVEGGREMQGAAMYNWQQLIADMQALKRNEEAWLPGEADPVNTEEKRLNVMILEGCLAAHGVSLREVADIKVGISEWDDIDRFYRKLARDTDLRGPRRYTSGWVIFDFAGKQFHEQTDIIMRDLVQGGDFVWRYTADRGWIFERIKQPTSATEIPLALFPERHDYIYALSDYEISLQFSV